MGAVNEFAGAGINTVKNVSTKNKLIALHLI